MSPLRTIKNMFGPDIPEDRVVGIGLGAPSMEELALFHSQLDDEFTLSAKLRQQTEILGSILAWLLAQAGGEVLTITGPTLQRITRQFSLNVSVDAERDNLYLRVVRVKGGEDEADSDIGLGASEECSNEAE